MLVASEELKTNIEAEISKISGQTLRKVAKNVMRRVRCCIQEEGGHFQHLL